MPPLDDAHLVRAAQAGDRQALEKLLRMHHPRIHAVCRRILGNDTDADDAAQDALISVVRGLPRFDGTSSFSTWVYRVATNAALDDLRRRGRRPVPSDLGQTTLVDQRTDDAHGAVEQRDVLHDALRGLREEFRVAVVLRDVADLDYEEIGDILGVPPGTVRSRIARGRAALADALGNRTGDDERQTRTPGRTGGSER